MHFLHTIGQRGGAGLQDVGGLDFKQLLMAHRIDGTPTIACGHVFRAKFLAAPGAQNDVRVAAHDLGAVRNDAVLAQGLRSQLRKAIVATCHAHQLRHPADRADVRTVPLFKIHLGPARPGRNFGGHCLLHRPQVRLQVGNPPQALFRLAHHGGDLVEHRKNLGHAALVEDSDLHALAHQLGRNVGLHVGEAEHTIRLQGQNFVDLGAGKRAHARLLVPRAARPHGVARDAHNPRLLPQQVQPFRSFLGHADDALRALRKMQQIQAHTVASGGGENSATTAAGQDGNQA